MYTADSGMGAGAKTKVAIGSAGASACFTAAVLLSPTVAVVVSEFLTSRIDSVASVWSASPSQALALAVILLTPAIIPLYRPKAWVLPILAAVVAGCGAVCMVVYNTSWADGLEFTTLGPQLLVGYALSMGTEALVIRSA